MKAVSVQFVFICNVVLPTGGDKLILQHFFSYFAQGMGSIYCTSIIFWTPTKKQDSKSECMQDLRVRYCRITDTQANWQFK